MPPQVILKFSRQVPFQPIRVYVSDGSAYDVNEPYEIIVSALQVCLALDPDDNGLPQRSVYIAPNAITRIELLPGAVPPTEPASTAA